MSNYIEDNNFGVHLLQQGHYDAALPTFIGALELFRQQVVCKVSNCGNAEQLEEGRSPSRVGRRSRRARSRRIKRDHSFFDAVDFGDLRQESQVSTERLHMYTRAFVLSSSVKDGPCAVNHRDGTSAIILFNIGVTLHAKAIRTGSSQLLSKALTSYRLGLSSAEYWALYYSCGKNSLPQMTILNNLALLHVQCMQIKESVLFLRSLQRVMYETFDLTREQRAPFDWNVTILRQGQFHVCPASAA